MSNNSKYSPKNPNHFDLPVSDEQLSHAKDYCVSCRQPIDKKDYPTRGNYCQRCCEKSTRKTKQAAYQKTYTDRLKKARDLESAKWTKK